MVVRETAATAAATTAATTRARPDARPAVDGATVRGVAEVGPPDAASLLELVAESLSLKDKWDEADMAAMRRWRAGKPVGDKVKERLARRIADGALRPVFVDFEHQRVSRLAETAAAGLLVLISGWDEHDRTGWWDGVAATVAVVLGHLGIPAMKVYANGAAAQMPRWAFAGYRGKNVVRPTAESVRSLVRSIPDDDGRLRKNARALARGDRSRRDTIDEFHAEARKAAEADKRPPPHLGATLALERFWVGMGIGPVGAAQLLAQIERIRAGLPEVGEPHLEAALRGEVFAAIRRRRSRGGPGDTAV